MMDFSFKNCRIVHLLWMCSMDFSAKFITGHLISFWVPYLPWRLTFRKNNYVLSTTPVPPQCTRVCKKSKIDMALNLLSIFEHQSQFHDPPALILFLKIWSWLPSLPSSARWQLSLKGSYHYMYLTSKSQGMQTALCSEFTHKFT